MNWQSGVTAPKDGSTVLLEMVELGRSVIYLGYWANYSGPSADYSGWCSAHCDCRLEGEPRFWAEVHKPNAAHAINTVRDDLREIMES